MGRPRSEQSEVVEASDERKAGPRSFFAVELRDDQAAFRDQERAACRLPAAPLLRIPRRHVVRSRREAGAELEKAVPAGKARKPSIARFETLLCQLLRQRGR